MSGEPKKCEVYTNETDMYIAWWKLANSRIYEQVGEIAELKARIAYLEEQLRWRPVSEKPTNSNKLIYEVKYVPINGGQYTYAYYHNGWIDYYSHVKVNYEITHYRPIPELGEQHE